MGAGCDLTGCVLCIECMLLQAQQEQPDDDVIELDEVFEITQQRCFTDGIRRLTMSSYG